jgi:hypothetical protein
MTRIAIAVALLLPILVQPVAAETWCNGIIVSNRSCIGSESNVPPPIVYCDDQSDSRCRR